MRREGLVTDRRESKNVFYALSDTRLESLIAALCEAFGPDDTETTRRHGHRKKGDQS